ncbi:Gfo/Idh/MocA family oxidoreductase [Lichenihabitans sp. PAMC28606]|uniref:Gfo/Idh/MocA family protein n=1 Tax=Lichenihabitans sp. PAMC28606 TaxID=2880932 RepID=UPI001D0B21D9|nr:Gfo/Idh/MocA family oxidoreductase [Lichenihabitans sp. PAMC28606]UDL93382.1 Gfo/Idh/MocA family oxidoreductase [Lichenihabitans sp. PAMC28606]
MAVYSIAIIGVGKISQDQHLPVIANNPNFRLAALVSQRGLAHPDVPTFKTPAELYAAMPDLDAVAICTPPSARYTIAREALDAGKHVLLEKPPAPTVTELTDLAGYAATLDRVIFTTWHSQYNAAVEEVRSRLVGERIKRLTITWKEDVRRWHPGQDWIWEVGGFGVFDPGINALSILTRIMPGPIFVHDASLVYPSNRDMPIAADLVFSSPVASEAQPGALTAAFDWRQTGEQSWTIDIETEAGQRFNLTGGGSKLAIDGTPLLDAPTPQHGEYEGIYKRFATLLDSGSSAVDVAPFQLVADAFMIGKRVVTEPFED